MRIATYSDACLASSLRACRTSYSRGEVVVAVKPSWRRLRCPECGEVGTIHETSEPRFRCDLASGETVTRLLYAAGCVDELSCRRHHNYVTVVVDHERQRIVWVGEVKSSDTLAEFFKALGPARARLRTHVTMDLSAA